MSGATRTTVCGYLAVAGVMAGLAVASGAVVGAGSPVAQADASSVEITAAVSTMVLRSTGDHSFDLLVRLQNAGPAQQIELQVAGKPWPAGTRGGPLLFGVPAMDGPGDVTRPPLSVPAILPGACFRGPAYDFTVLVVSIPTQMTTTLVLPITAVVPAWPATDYTPLLARYEPGGQPNLQPIAIGVPHVTMTGPTGFRIALSIGHRTTWIRVRTPVTITGTTSPPVPHALVRVTAAHSPTSGAQLRHRRLLAVTRTNSHGQFRLPTWRPPHSGGYEVLAGIVHPSAGLLHDGTCPTAVNVLPKH
jgi:hypothetical protein